MLVDGLLDAGLEHEDGAMGRVDLHVLAALCAQHAAWLDDRVRERVRRSTAALYPLLDHDRAKAVARLGPAALDGFPAPESLTPDYPSVRYMAGLIAEIGGSEAVPHARAWVLAHPQVGSWFIHDWSNFPPHAYATEVLTHCELSAAPLLISDRERLRAVRHLPSVRDLSLRKSLPESEISEALEGKRALESLYISDNQRLTDLSCLSPVRDRLGLLSIGKCSGIRDLRPLMEFTALYALFLDVAHVPPSHWEQIAALPSGLALLVLGNLPVDGLSLIPAHSGVTHLGLASDRPFVLDGLGAWSSLMSLKLSGLKNFGEALTELRELPRINEIEFSSFPLPDGPGDAPPVPSIEDLTVPSPADGADLSLLRTLFPETSHLTLRVSDHTGKLDLTSLHDWPGLTVDVRGLAHRVLLGADELGDRLTAAR
ncbi:hypothetical protein [Streptomyces sp. SM11]|uniref:hypothetical protein n=1 Tax=Streptomyces sp. SM11 TaxID=565557 RepID=UPI0021561FF9|nr:hypothetical protein [Streptomyces sp. SM11]